MITVEIKGGLGNQMFQYALGRSLALHNNTDLQLDLSNYTATTGDPFKGVRLFNLSDFNINAGIASKDSLQAFAVYRSASLHGKVARFLNRIGPYYTKEYIVEPRQNFFSFDTNLVDTLITKDIYISGFWQTEKYFKDYSDIIRKEFTVRHQPEGKNRETILAMKNQNAVAVHIRHGDNANAVAPNHGVLPMDFYRQAAELIQKKVANPVFYLFSDDIPWAREQLSYLKPIIVADWNDDSKNYDDMRLMASCKHHIIANSTFSWWGAWLGAHEGQIVVAPKKYYQTGDRTYPDYYPAHWTLM